MADADAARRILDALGLGDADLEPLGLGLASDAWLVRPGDRTRDRDRDRRSVLRVANDPTGPTPTYAMEHAVMARLTAHGAPVPRPIVGDWSLDDWPGPAFSLTTWVPGAPLRREDHPRAVLAIAGFLQALHGLAIPGVGALVVGGDGLLRGEQDEIEAAILAWAQRPFWPLGGADLAAHPALADRPDLRAALEVHRDTTRAALVEPPWVAVHSDLHEENLLDDAGTLSVIDFGETLVVPAAWEFASIGYFLGWPMADAVLGAYLQGAAPGDPDAVDRWRRRADRLGLAFGVYRWHQDRELAMDEDVHDAAFLDATLRRLGGR